MRDKITFGGQTIMLLYVLDGSGYEKYVYDKYLNSKYPKTRFIDKDNAEDVLEYFYKSEELQNFIKILKNCLKKIMKEYKGFPSALLETKDITITFMDQDLVTYKANVEHSEKFYSVFINFTFQQLMFSDRSVSSIISHELYHVIGDFHEGEAIQSKKLQRWEQKLFNVVSSNRDDVYRWIQVSEKELGSNIQVSQKEWDADLNLLKRNTLVNFYGKCRSIYWNQICDTGLNIIALELEDEEYILETLRRNTDSVSDLKFCFRPSNNVAKAIKSNSKLAPRKSKFLLNIEILFQFMLAFVYMPFNIIPYALIDDYWHPRKKFFVVFKEKNYHKKAKGIIKEFERQISEYFEPEAVSAFFQFWKHYKEMTKHMNIWIDPLDVKVKRQIHNAESLHSAKEGYKLLNRLFKELYQNVKKYE